MRKHLNTLFVTLEGAYLRKDGAAIEIRHEGETKLRVPLHNLDGIVCFGWDISCSAALMAACADSFMTSPRDVVVTTRNWARTTFEHFANDMNCPNRIRISSAGWSKNTCTCRASRSVRTSTIRMSCMRLHPK